MDRYNSTHLSHYGVPGISGTFQYWDGWALNFSEKPCGPYRNPVIRNFKLSKRARGCAFTSQTSTSNANVEAQIAISTITEKSAYIPVY